MTLSSGTCGGHGHLPDDLRSIVHTKVNKSSGTLARSSEEGVATINSHAAQPAPDTPGTGRRLRRSERREQILAAATRAFARAGFAATSLDDVAGEAGITRVILYRHFESKADMYRAVLDRACTRLTAAVGVDDFTDQSIPALVRAAADDPDAFRLLFQHAAREPEFRDQVDRLSADNTDVAYRNLAAMIPEPSWTRWAAHLVPTVAIEGVTAWLDAGQPDPDVAAERIAQAVAGVIQAAQPR